MKKEEPLPGKRFSQVVSIRVRIHIRRVKGRTLQRAQRSANGFNQIAAGKQKVSNDPLRELRHPNSTIFVAAE